MKGLKQSTACVLYPRAVHSYQPFVKRAFAPEMNLSDPSHHLLAQETCARMLRERKADILLDDVSLLQQYLVRMRHCTATDLFVPTQISFGRRLPALMHSRSHARTRARAHTHRFWSFYATDKSRDLVANISVQVLLLSYTPEYTELLAKYFGRGMECPVAAVSPTSQITLTAMHGAFVVFFAALALAFALAASRALHAHAGPATQVQMLAETHHTSDGEMLRVLLQRTAAIQVWGSQ